MDEKNTNFSFYTLLPGEECLLELQIASFDDQHETVNVTAELTGVLANIKKAIDNLKEKLSALIKCGCENPVESKKRSVFVVTNMRCFIASYYSIKGKKVGCLSCSAASSGAMEYTEYTAFPRNVLTEYNSYTCKKEKYFSKSFTCFCGKKENYDKYNIVLSVGLNTKGEKSNIAPNRNLVMTLEEDAITSYDQLNGVIAMLAKLAQQAND